MLQERIIVQWHDSFSTGIKLIDDQHKELLNLTNKLFSSCLAGHKNAQDAFFEITSEAVDYVGYHFSTEEKIMERIGYPEFNEHKSFHAAFIQEIIKKIDEFNAGKFLAPIFFVYFLKNWVLEHIAVTDKKLGDYILAMSKSGKLQNIILKVKNDKTMGRIDFI